MSSTLIRSGIGKGEFFAQPDNLRAAAMVGAMAEALITHHTWQLTTGQRKKQIQHVVQSCLPAVSPFAGA